MAEFKERQVFTRRELPVLALLALGALGLLLWLRAVPSGRTAVLEVEGAEIARRELSALSGPESLKITGANGVELEVEFCTACSPKRASALSACQGGWC